MAGRLGSFLKNVWSKEPVVTAACGIGLLVPVRDNGALPNVPKHPCDPEGPSLDWLKKM
ncbi:UNVERIFIED_CONTAM: hypothetical protein FKN15_035027 [Acipenser sinensis]